MDKWRNNYKGIFQNTDVHALKTMANRIVRFSDNIENHKEDSAVWALPDKPIGYPGYCNAKTASTMIQWIGTS